MRILNIVGARPNFMKAAPVITALSGLPKVEQVLVHTGQHYDGRMSKIFFRQLGIRPPDVNLEVGSGTHASQTALIMNRFEPVLAEQRADLVLVYGDVNSTLAAALVCAKSLVPLGHVEAGLRSFDRTMPEEVNRVLTDQISDLLFTPSADADRNLLKEGIAPEKIHLVGNVMIDTLVRLAEAAASSDVVDGLGLKRGEYCLVTLHRPSNVDQPGALARILSALGQISRHLPVVFPVHPRTHQKLKEIKVRHSNNDLRLIEPLGYVDFLALQRSSRVVITDSGGIQEETTCLGVPCLTIRENTERPVTVSLGTNTLVGTDMEGLKTEVKRILDGQGKKGRIPPLWDGKASERIAQVILRVSDARTAPEP